MIAEPLFEGAVHDTVACAFPGAAVAVGGTAGIPIVTAVDFAEAGLGPREFTAMTVHAVPFVSPLRRRTKKRVTIDRS